jgi:SseB protein C-terminal domain
MREKEQFKTRNIAFVGEQDGPTERELKRAVAAILKRALSIECVFLLKVLYEPERETKMALVMEETREQEEQIVDSVERIFKGLFDESQSLDFLFLTGEQTAQLRSVTEPFYTRDVADHARPI